MRPFTALLSATVLLLGPAAVAQDSIQTIQAEIHRTYTKVPKAYAAHDLKAFAAVLTPDLVVVNPDGTKQDLKANLALVREDMAATKTIRSAKLVFHKTTVSGKEVVSEATMAWDSDWVDVKGDYGPKGKVYPVLWQQRCVFTHVKKGDDWLLKRQVCKEEPRVTVNGKPFLPLKK